VTVNAQPVSVGTTATRLDAADTSASFTRSCLVRNRGSSAVFIGGAGVTTATGLQLDPGESLTADLRPAEPLFGVVASGTVTCHVMLAGGS
jgi:hypothetical protein